MKKRLLLVLSAVLIAMHPLPILAADAEDYEILQEEYNELKSKYKKLKKKYNALKEKYEGSAEEDQDQKPSSEDTPVIEESGNDVSTDGNPIIYEDSNGYTYTYLWSEFFDWNGKRYLLNHFNFYNHSGKDAKANTSSSMRAFQNNIEIQHYSLIGSNVKEIDLASQYIRDGGNADVAFAILLDDESDVIVSMMPTFYFGKVDPFEFIIHLPDMEADLLS